MRRRLPLRHACDDLRRHFLRHAASPHTPPSGAIFELQARHSISRPPQLLPATPRCASASAAAMPELFAVIRRCRAAFRQLAPPDLCHAALRASRRDAFCDAAPPPYYAAPIDAAAATLCRRCRDSRADAPEPPLPPRGSAAFRRRHAIAAHSAAATPLLMTPPR